MDTYVIAWTDRLAIGSPRIDAQHRRLIELIEGIPEQPTPRDEEILREALKYAAEHFTDEEVYMAEVGYPGLAAHHAEHRRLTTILMSYKRQYEKGTTDLYSFKQFMFCWVRDHIMDEDQKIGLYLKQRDAEPPPSEARGARG